MKIKKLNKLHTFTNAYWIVLQKLHVLIIYFTENLLSENFQLIQQIT